MKDQYLLIKLSTSFSSRILRTESLKATSEAILEAVISAFSLDLAIALSVAILDASTSASILDLLRALSLASLSA